MKKNLKNNLILFFSLLFLLGANFVFALEIDYPRVPGAASPQDFLKTAAPEDILSLYAKYLVNLCIWAGGILALAGLIYSGILYLLSTGKPQRMASAKDQITAAFFGLLLLLSSFLILKTLSPQFINLKIPTLQQVQIPQKPIIPLPKTIAINSSIEVQVPFVRIIEKIFETYISDYPKPKEEKIPRMTKIETNAQTSKEIADKLKKQSEDLYNYSKECTCRSTDPETPCGNNKSGDTTWKCNCGSCSETEPCTSDPCKEVREDIQKTEDKNFKAIYSGTEISYTNESGEEIKTTTSLTAEQIKTEEEIRLLEEELDRLKRAGKFIKECPLRDLTSLAQFYSKKGDFEKQNWTIRETKFWDDVSIVYYKLIMALDPLGNPYPSGKKMEYDFATFYCAVSGAQEQSPSYVEPKESLLTGEESIKEAEEVLSEKMAVSSEAPVGEIIDRTKRVTQLLIDKLKTLVDWEKKLIDAVDKLQVLISQCSSQRGCERRCTCFDCLPQCIVCDASGCHCREGCEGWIYCCADSSPDYPGKCKDRDEDTPCPYKEIEDQLKKIQDISQQITDLVEGKKKNGEETPEEKIKNIGVIQIINEIVPEILKDLEWKVRKPMKECSSQGWLTQDIVLFNCLQTKGATIPPQSQVLKECCQTESLDQNTGQIKQTVYGDCLEECYLKKETNTTDYFSIRFVSEYRKCVQDCLDKKGQALGDKDLPNCIHELNFYCANVK